MPTGWSEIPYSFPQWTPAGALPLGPGRQPWECSMARSSQDRNFFITPFLLWNTTDLSEPLNRAMKEFHIILLESQKRNLKIQCPRCSWRMSTSCSFVIWHHKKFQGRLCEQRESRGQGAAGSKLCLPYFDDLICYIKWSRKKRFPMSIRSYSWF